MKEVNPKIFDRLTYRQRQVACSLARGLPHKQVAAELGIAIKTVDQYVQTINRRLGVTCHIELTHLAIVTGAIEPLFVIAGTDGNGS